MANYDDNDLNLDNSFFTDIKKDIAKQVTEQVDRSKDDLPNFDYVDDLLNDTTLSLTQDFRYFTSGEYPDEEEENDWAEEGAEEIGVRKTTAEEESGKKKGWFRRMPVWGRILTVVGIVLLAVLLGAFLYYEYLLSLVNIKPSGPEETTQAEELTTTEAPVDQEEIDELNNVDGLEEIDEDDIDWNTYSDYRKEEGVINVLLLGLDKQGGGKGRSDSIIIVTLNENTKTLSLCSIMRDSYVKIPGHKASKINVAHALGGAPLAVDTIQQNFNVAIDGYVEVDFDAFAKCIDAVGGVEVTLTQEEVNYLNGNRSSILDKSQRNVRVGTQTLNGAQALGYARIRKVPTSDGLKNDFGRTARQRRVLDSLFEKYKSASIMDLLGMMQAVLPLVTTDLNKDEISSLLYKVVAIRPNDLETLSIPLGNAYADRFVEGAGSVLALDMNKNRDAIHEFIFGSVE